MPEVPAVPSGTEGDTRSVAVVVVGLSIDEPHVVDIQTDGRIAQLPAVLFGHPQTIGGRYILTARPEPGAGVGDPVEAYLLAQLREQPTSDRGLLRRDWWEFWHQRLTGYRKQRDEARRA